MENLYSFNEEVNIPSPALIYYRDIIIQNIAKTIKAAKGAKHLWPHVKTHKMIDVLRLQMDAGIHRFKCATIAEVEMAASCKASNVLLAYPLIGPNISRFITLIQAYPSTHFWAIGDDFKQLSLLDAAALNAGITISVLVDVNLGMNRTGVTLEHLETFYRNASSLSGINLRGFHCYDGHRTEQDFTKRVEQAIPMEENIFEIYLHLQKDGFTCDTMIFGGTPSMPCYTDIIDKYPHTYLSPGTLFVNDYGYSYKYPDLNYTPGAAILTRVISHPLPGHFTLDLGYKGISSDPVGTNGILVGFPHAKELFQSEEHWAFAMEEGYEAECPEIGLELYVIPTHICPTTALYPSVAVVAKGSLCDSWEVTARNRKITY